MRILVSTLPFAGHMFPVLAVAAELVRRGHDVRWYGAPSHAARIEAAGVPFVGYTRAREVTHDNVTELYPERARIKSLPKQLAYDWARIFTDNTRGWVDDLLELHREWPFEAILCDSAFYPPTIVGPVLGVPTYGIGPGAPIQGGAGHPPPFLGLRPPRHALDRLVHSGLRRMVESTCSEGLPALNEVRAEHGLEPLTTRNILTFDLDVHRHTWHAWLEELDYPSAVGPAKASYVGALVPPSGERTRHPALDRIAAWPGRVVVVSQGTVDNHDLGKLVRPTIEALAGRDTLVVAVTGGRGTDALRADLAGPNVVVEDHLHFDDLLPHADLLVSNGGAGSVLTALAHGVPLVLAGKREGKADMTARLDWAGVGIDLRTETPKPEAIARAARAVFSDAALHDRVRALAGRLRSHDGVATVCDELLADAASATRATPAATPIPQGDPT